MYPWCQNWYHPSTANAPSPLTLHLMVGQTDWCITKHLFHINLTTCDRRQIMRGFQICYLIDVDMSTSDKSSSQRGGYHSTKRLDALKIHDWRFGADGFFFTYTSCMFEDHRVLFLLMSKRALMSSNMRNSNLCSDWFQHRHLRRSILLNVGVRERFWPLRFDLCSHPLMVGMKYSSDPKSEILKKDKIVCNVMRLVRRAEKVFLIAIVWNTSVTRAKTTWIQGQGPCWEKMNRQWPSYV